MDVVSDLIQSKMTMDNMHRPHPELPQNAAARQYFVMVEDCQQVEVESILKRAVKSSAVLDPSNENDAHLLNALADDLGKSREAPSITSPATPLLPSPTGAQPASLPALGDKTPALDAAGGGVGAAAPTSPPAVAPAVPPALPPQPQEDDPQEDLSKYPPEVRAAMEHMKIEKKRKAERLAKMIKKREEAEALKETALYKADKYVPPGQSMCLIYAFFTDSMQDLSYSLSRNGSPVYIWKIATMVPPVF